MQSITDSTNSASSHNLDINNYIKQIINKFHLNKIHS